MFCLNRECVLIISGYIGKDFTFGPLKSHRQIEDRYVGVLSHKFYFCRDIAMNNHRYTGNIVIPRIVIERYRTRT